MSTQLRTPLTQRRATARGDPSRSFFSSKQRTVTRPGSIPTTNASAFGPGTSGERRPSRITAPIGSHQSDGGSKTESRIGENDRPEKVRTDRIDSSRPQCLRPKSTARVTHVPHPNRSEMNRRPRPGSQRYWIRSITQLRQVHLASTSTALIVRHSEFVFVSTQNDIAPLVGATVLDCDAP